MVLPLSRLDSCKCGGLKDKRATQCSKCRRTAWEENRKVRRRVKCKCGELMDFRAEQCLKCFHTAEHDRRLSRRICACGGRKGEKSDKCKTCQDQIRNPVKDGLVTCVCCDQQKDTAQFYPRSGKQVGKPRRECIDCHSLLSRKKHIVSKCREYGLGECQINLILRLKQISCWICKTKVAKFHIDHCHATNKFRGLLCSNCNSGIGLLGDDAGRLQRAAQYVSEFQQRGTATLTSEQMLDLFGCGMEEH